MSFEWLIDTLSRFGFKLYDAASDGLSWFFTPITIDPVRYYLSGVNSVIHLWFPDVTLASEQMSFTPADVMLMCFGAFLLFKAFAKLLPT